MYLLYLNPEVSFARFVLINLSHYRLPPFSVSFSVSYQSLFLISKVFHRLCMRACKLNVRGVEVYDIVPDIKKNHFQMRSHASCNSKNMLGRCKMVTQIGMQKKIKAGKSTPDHVIYYFRSIC